MDIHGYDYIVRASSKWRLEYSENTSVYNNCLWNMSFRIAWFPSGSQNVPEPLIEYHGNVLCKAL